MPAVLTSCDFNNNNVPFCQFRQDVDDDSDWTRHRGPTPTNGTGPEGDYPSGDGYYIYHECDNVASRQKARLISPAIHSSLPQICVQFWYYMYGSDHLNHLAVLVRDSGTEEKVWEKVGFQSPSWLGADLTVTTPVGQTVNIVFEAMRGTTSSCDTALDNIIISEGACPGCLSECDFDTFDDLCGWTTEAPAEIFGWEQWPGSTETEGTGPDDDYSKPGRE
ncbi:zonadhesin-like [Brienomyrus brachyistius]|uniref:zonadhesin-like n=1 Tax=Brienomyrus brachyistius TaxID=42636 RepID=UPI0020B28B3E|nr:zonadhesin-like [Brienomyrus brachyistius]